MDPTVKSMTPKQRERWAWGYVAVLAIAALAWGVKVYLLPTLPDRRAAIGKDVLSRLQNGDIIFQPSTSGQSRAIQLATGSRYSHCGILFQTDTGSWYVVEAVQPVKRTPLVQWVARGQDGRFAVKRMGTGLTEGQQAALRKAVGQYIGKDYDPYFGWGDDRIYCSELVWKAYQQATGREVGTPQALGRFHLDGPLVAEKLKERYGEHIPLEEPVISPAAIFESPLLTPVISR